MIDKKVVGVFLCVMGMALSLFAICLMVGIEELRERAWKPIREQYARECQSVGGTPVSNGRFYECLKK